MRVGSCHRCAINKPWMLPMNRPRSAELQLRAMTPDHAKLELRAPGVGVHGPNAKQVRSTPSLPRAWFRLTLAHMQTTGVTLPGSITDLARFLKSLAEEGRGVVSFQPLDDEAAEATAVLEQIDTHARHELALDAPAFCAATALWAARLLYHLGQ